MDVPHTSHPMFNHNDPSPYRIPVSTFVARPPPANLVDMQAERVSESLALRPPPLENTHTPSLPIGMPWMEQHYRPNLHTETRDQKQPIMKVKEPVNDTWHDVKSPVPPVPERKEKEETKPEIFPTEFEDQEIASNFVPMSWSRTPKFRVTPNSSSEGSGERSEDGHAAVRSTMTLEPSGFTCIQCGHVVHRSQLAKHVRMHTADRPHKCEVCGRAFRQKSNLIVHMRMHTGELPFKCDMCGKAFRQKSILVTHVRTHTKEMPYKCHMCPKAFTQKSNLVEHIRVHTGEKPYRCPECNKAFAQKSNLVVHVRGHTGETPFQCDTCGKAFRQKSILTTHIRTHTGELPFKCTDCDRAFAQKSNLVEHCRQHTGERPFICKECNKAFIRHQDLLQHMRHHTGRKPYDCSECGKMFIRKKHLEQHAKSHMEHRFKCGVCGQGFMDENLMVIHLTTHCHCHICGISYRSKEELIEHCRLHAMGMPDTSALQGTTLSKLALSRHSATPSHTLPNEMSRDVPSCSKTFAGGQTDIKINPFPTETVTKDENSTKSFTNLS
ncbi:uncharacterized protein [Diadema setosum]|uniref:uncharacterized protein n=1 Tax=Diadema setosum TaxID=31175 RepID=UPI003B3ADB60